MRKKGGLTQSMVAVLLGKTAQAVRDYEAGNYTPDKDAMQSIAHLTGLKKMETLWRTWEAKKPAI